MMHSSPPRLAEKPLTSRCRSVYETIMSFTKQHGYPPTVREIGAIVGLSSSSTVQYYLKTLERRGFIHRDSTKPRALVSLNDPNRLPFTASRRVPVVGRVAAGVPITALENLEGDYDVPSDFARQETTFMLRVKGESMIDVGIFDGDVIVVEPEGEVIDGRIIVAMLDGEATVKRYYRENDLVRLQPENKTMSPIYAHMSDLEIVGTVAGCFHPF